MIVILVPSTLQSLPRYDIGDITQTTQWSMYYEVAQILASVSMFKEPQYLHNNNSQSKH